VDDGGERLRLRLGGGQPGGGGGGRASEGSSGLSGGGGGGRRARCASELGSRTSAIDTPALGFGVESNSRRRNGSGREAEMGRRQAAGRSV
jgi:hypothetical protein